MSKNGNNNRDRDRARNVGQKNVNTATRKSNNVKNPRNQTYGAEKEWNYFHLPIFLVVAILPLIVRLKTYDPKMAQFSWFSGQTEYVDFFLYYKQNLLIILSTVMLAVVIYKVYKERRSITVLPVFIPLAVYAVLALLSAAFSKYPYFSFHGSIDQFESVFALLGYCIIVFYVYLHIGTEGELQSTLKVLICGALLLGLLGLLQFIGHDFFTTELGYRLIMPAELRGDAGIDLNFGVRRVYMTLFNPNYVGVYVALVAPVIFILLFFQKKVVWIVLSVLSVILLLIGEFGSQSLAGFIGLGAAMVLMLIFLRRYIFKKPIIAVSAIAFVLIGIIVMNVITGNFLVNKLKNTFQIPKTEYLLTDMETLGDGVSLTFKGQQIKVRCSLDESNVLSLQVLDKDNNTIATNFDPSANIYRLEDSQLSDITLGLDVTQPGVFYIQVEENQYRFTNLTEDGTYYYVNLFNKLDKLKTAPSFLFQGYGDFASGRGYIWSRTIPLLKDHIILGSGPDTFTMTFPQNDYMNMSLYGYSGQIMSKPHNLYLQIGVQTGVLSLIAFLVFYGMYAASSIRLYIRGRFDSYYAKVGVAVFIGTAAYMVTGLTNDSSITVAPVFWALMGVGIAVNHKVSSVRKQGN
ncbi:MAG TPA: O-antigen ligase family protein [Clostridiales bacterium]|nr:O-antigen ligase family protein [Clostridiales bacterium]